MQIYTPDRWILQTQPQHCTHAHTHTRIREYSLTLTLTHTLLARIAPAYLATLNSKRAQKYHAVIERERHYHARVGAKCGKGIAEHARHTHTLR